MNIVSLDEAAQAVADGELVACPTETFFGFAADPRSKPAVESLCEYKQRSLGQGIPLISGSYKAFEDLLGLEDERIKRTRERITKHYWPGALSAVVSAKSSDELGIQPAVYGLKNSLAVRISSHLLAGRLAGLCGGLITSTSVNPHGLPPASTAAEVDSYFPELKIIEGKCGAGGCSVKVEQPSTIVDFRASPPKVIREGLISRAELIACFPGELE